MTVLGRWRVPYTTDATRGFLVVTATSREDAINAAIEAHRGSRQLRGQNGDLRSRIRLTPPQRAAIQYGEPQQLAAQPTQAGAA